MIYFINAPKLEDVEGQARRTSPMCEFLVDSWMKFEIVSGVPASSQGASTLRTMRQGSGYIEQVHLRIISSIGFPSETEEADW